MLVKLVNHTPDPERAVAVAARMCYSSLPPLQITDKLDDYQIVALIRELVRRGHFSPLEHASFTFIITGSRAMSHQFVRHRIASFSQRSQRYVKESGFSYITPPSIQVNAVAEQIFARCMNELQKTYNELLQLGVPAEDARYVLPNACETSFVCTMNARSLHNFFRLRQCQRAQWEIRRVANLMLREVRKVAPVLFAQAGPPCVVDGVCPEGDKSCGFINRLRVDRSAGGSVD